MDKILIMENGYCTGMYLCFDTYFKTNANSRQRTKHFCDNVHPEYIVFKKQ